MVQKLCIPALNFWSKQTRMLVALSGCPVDQDFEKQVKMQERLKKVCHFCNTFLWHTPDFQKLWTSRNIIESVFCPKKPHP